MTLRSEWDAIAARIRGIEHAGAFHVSRLVDKMGGGPQEVVPTLLHPEAQAIHFAVRDFEARHEGTLASGTADAIKRFLQASERYARKDSAYSWANLVTALITVRSEIDYHMADHSANSRRITERAFLHLQRSIIANDDVQQQWRRAFDKGEVACEKLGAAHLLLHGIWAFKVHAEGERTDLVMNEPITDLAPVERVAEALVLTEWKKIVGPGDLDRKAAEARRQASRYGSGVLGGIELASYAYIVLVSEHHVAVEHLNRDDSGRHYVHVNIPVDPQPPSKK